MALTDAQKDLILETIATKFNGNLELFQSWLERSKLETERAQIESEIRKAQDQRDAAVTGAEEEIQTLQALLQAKTAEIDSL